MEPLELVRLDRLMDRSSGRHEIVIGLIDGPVATDHPDLAGSYLRQIGGGRLAGCALTDSVACLHGTFVAGILSARRGSAAPAICPDCSLLIRPIFPEGAPTSEYMPTASPEDLAAAIFETVGAGARVINLSAGLGQPSMRTARNLTRALDFAAARGVITVAAAGNQGMLGSSVITRHPWVIPVAGCDLRGRPIDQSNFGSSIGRRGLSAPAQNITSLGTSGELLTIGGTSAAAPFVTGTIALLCMTFPQASPTEVRSAISRGSGGRRNTVIPPLLDAWAAYRRMAVVQAGR